MAMDLLFDFYTDSFPFMDGEGMEHDRDVQGPYDNAEYVRPRLAALFQQKIGVAADLRSAKQLAQLGAIQMLNKYHFPAIDIPVRDALEIGPHDGPADAVHKAELHSVLLATRLREFQNYLLTETGHFHEAESRLSKYLITLSSQ
jgi:hypothetical protein